MDILGRFRINVLFVVLVTFMVLSGLSGQVYAEGEGYTNKVMTQESSDNFEFDSSTGTILKYNGAGGDVEIPAQIAGVAVKCIGTKAFWNYQSISRVVIPEGVEIIDAEAFSYCENLTEIVLPVSLTEIRDSAFEYANINNLVLPDNVTTVGLSAFAHNAGLTHVYISKSVASVKGSVFMNCYSLTQIEVEPLSNNFCAVDNVLFSKDQTKLIAYAGGKTNESYQVPASVKTIDKGAFMFAKLKSITLPEGLEIIGSNAFASSSIQEISIPDSVTEIGYYAFSGSQLTTVYTSENSQINKMEYNCFDSCTNLTTVTLPKNLDKLDFRLFLGCTSLKEIIIPESITAIDSDVFAGCSGLSKIQLPTNLRELGSGVFSGCGFQSLDLPNSIETMGTGVFTECKALTQISLPGSLTKIPSLTFYNCSQLGYYQIPEQITEIGDSAFSGCVNLEKVDANSTLQTIGKRAFQDCINLKNIVIPKSVNSVEDGAFHNCSQLKTIVFESAETIVKQEVPIWWNTIPSTAIVIGYEPSTAKEYADKNGNQFKLIEEDLSEIFKYENYDDGIVITGYNGTGGNIVIPVAINGKKVVKIGDNAFANLESLTSVVFPDGIIEIGVNSFLNCSNLKQIKLPNNLADMRLAFQGCISLNEITIPNNYVLFDGAFKNCSNLTIINLSDGLICISNSAFENCISIESVHIPESLKVIEDNAFYGCKGLKNINTPLNVNKIGKQAFKGCTSLTSINLPKKLKEIEESTFSYCSSLTSVSIPENITIIGESAFEGCAALTKITFNSSTTKIDSLKKSIPQETIIEGYSPSTAQEYAKKFGNPFHSLGVTNKLFIGADNNSFSNTAADFYRNDEILHNYNLSSELFSKLVEGQSIYYKIVLANKSNLNFYGACYGISAAMILSKVGEININNDPLNANYFYKLPSPKDNLEFRQMIFYYHLMQYLPDMNEDHAYNSAWYDSDGKNLSEVLKTISSKAKEVECGGIPFLISFEWKEGVVEATSEIIGHVEVVNGCELLSTGDQKIKLVDPNNQKDYDYLIINSGYDGFWFEDSSGQIIYANLPNWVGIGYQNISTLKSIENNSLETLENNEMGVHGTTFIVDSNNEFEMSNQGSGVLTYNENGIEGGIRPLNIDFVEGESESEDNSVEMKMTLPYSETYSVTPSEKGIDVLIVDDTRFADVNVTGAKEINFSVNNQIEIIGSNCNYEVLVPNLSNGGTIGFSDENSGNISIDRYQDGIRIKSDNMVDLKIKSLTINDASEFNVKTDKTELLIKDKPNDENGLVELYISENNNSEFNKKIGETSMATEPGSDPSPGSNEPSSSGPGGGGGGVTPTPTPNIDVTKALGEIAGAVAGSTVTVPVTNNEPVPISILEAAKGKDISIVFNYGSYTWTINGKSIQDLPTGVTTYDLSIKTIQNTTLSDLANDPNAIQIEISHNGAFPFSGQLSYQMDASLNGKNVYRYYFNETDKKLEYQDQAIVKDGVVHFDFEHASKYVISALLKPETASVNCTYQTQLENIGWQGFKSNGEVSGTVGESLRLEGIEIKTDDPTKLGVTYQTHVQNIGWQGYKKNGEMSGTSGESLRLEAIQIKLTGTEAENYDVYYQVYTEKFGWLDWAKNGESAGSEGYSYRLEAIKIVFQEKGTQAPGSTDRPFEKNVQCLYQTHVQNIGWQGFRTNGDMSGTQGQALRLEGIEIKFDGQENLGVEYSTHVQNIGWQDFVKDGAMSGTEGKSLRLEAIKIKLTGTNADKYDIYYQVHAQNFGWLDWAKNGEEAGTAGFGYRLEGIRITVVPKGEAAPGNTAKPFIEK